jgi:diaminohydroxyphosphoribosylaminopyrimidine deaminase/5-amino-6-(5-phosphoribosylamino)uracil reductase
MRHALRLASRALGRAAPNPAVGCVIVSREGRVVGRGWTQPGGRPHAETEALAQAGDHAHGATAYVTLEPCAHQGQTPPCADALIAAGIARVVAATHDPDIRVNGLGFNRLESAGVPVTKGICEADAQALNAGFFNARLRSRPLVALKIAESADGFVADANGNSRWITSATARQHGHLLRARHEAILTGIGTVLADDPLLTCRLPGMEHRSPVRVVLDNELRQPPTSRLAASAPRALDWTFAGETVAQERERALTDLGVEVLRVPGANGRLDLGAVLRGLAGRGITRVMVEAGPILSAALVAADLVDEAALFRSPREIGADGIDALDGLPLTALTQSTKLRWVSSEAVGTDSLDVFERA